MKGLLKVKKETYNLEILGLFIGLIFQVYLNLSIRIANKAKLVMSKYAQGLIFLTSLVFLCFVDYN